MFKIKLMSVPLIVAIVVSTVLAGLQVFPVYAEVINVTGNIAVTLVLALCTFFITFAA